MKSPLALSFSMVLLLHSCHPTQHTTRTDPSCHGKAQQPDENSHARRAVPANNQPALSAPSPLGTEQAQHGSHARAGTRAKQSKVCGLRTGMTLPVAESTCSFALPLSTKPSHVLGHSDFLALL